MKPKCGSKQPGAFRYHYGDVIEVNDIGEGTKQVLYVCTRCGHRWWVEYHENNTMTMYDDDETPTQSPEARRDDRENA